MSEPVAQAEAGESGRRRAPALDPRHVAKEPLVLSDAGFLLDGTNADSYTLNASGAAVLRALLAGVDSRDVWRSVVDRFDVPDDVARRDVVRFLARLRELGLVRTVEG